MQHLRQNQFVTQDGRVPHPGLLLFPPSHGQCLVATVGTQLPALQRPPVQDCTRANSLRWFTDGIHHPILGNPHPGVPRLLLYQILVHCLGRGYFEHAQGGYGHVPAPHRPIPFQLEGEDHDIGIAVAPPAFQLEVQAAFRHHFERPVPRPQNCNQRVDQVSDDELVPTREHFLFPGPFRRKFRCVPSRHPDRDRLLHDGSGNGQHLCCHERFRHDQAPQGTATANR